MRRLVPLICASSIFWTPAAVAQQTGDGAEYDLDTTIEVRGQATRIWQRPVFIIISVALQDDRTESWRIEFGADRDVAADTHEFLGSLRLGDELLITGHAATASGDRRIQATKILRPSDNLAWNR